MSLPGAGPPNSAERSAAALKSQSVNTGRGAVQTRSATRRPPTEPYHAPLSVPVSSALYKDPGSPGFGLAYEPSVLVDSFGDASCFNYNGSADIEFLVDGWYQFNVYATVHGATPGDVLHIEGDAGWDGTAAGYGVATGTEYVFLTASSIPFHSLADDGNSIDGRVYNHSGSSGTISAASIYVVRLA